MTLPNAITFLRILMVPLVYFALSDGYLAWAFILFVIAGLSDALDGFIAKRWDMQSTLGAYLDPLADKLLIVSVFAALAVNGTLPIWLVVIVVLRDLLIMAAIALAWLVGHAVAIRPLLISKLTTAAQIALASTVLADRAFVLNADILVAVLTGLVAALTLASFAVYMRAWLQHMATGPIIAIDTFPREATANGIAAAGRDDRPGCGDRPGIRDRPDFRDRAGQPVNDPLGDPLHRGSISDFEVGRHRTTPPDQGLS
ncbi:MAG: CDP-alcohol phosphatidyltransferase family protein [Pseudomonadota bacterium]